MKKIYFVLLWLVLLATTSSCEKFFDRQPEDKFAVDLFFKSESDLQYYCNGLIDAALPSMSEIALGADKNSDLAVCKNQDEFFIRGRHNASVASGWSYGDWSFLRQVAYMLENMPNAKAGGISAEKYDHYEGVARFFRAYATFDKVKQFGDCYWIDHVVSPADSTLLYGPRHDREFIMHKVLEDLKFSTEKCLTMGAGIKSDGCVYINKYVALALASRICLFEGTYRKYHSTNPSTGKPWTNEYETSEEILQLAVKYSKELMDSGAYSLYPDYGGLFTSTDLKKEEVIWGRSYSDKLAKGHTISYVFSASSQPYCAPTKDYVMMFLRSDGKPMASGEVLMSDEFEKRDKRLAACVLGPGMTKKDQSGSSVSFNPDFTVTPTGYQWIKWVIPEYLPMTSSAMSSFNAAPVFRYAEVLLNYAEAAEELGQMDEALWNKTVGQVRLVHGGISNSAYPGSSGYVADTWLREYYTDVRHPVSLTDALLEIRRERAVELALEGDLRYQDLMRWNMGDIIVRRYDNQGWKGLWVGKDDVTSGFDINGIKYTISSDKSTSETNYKVSTVSDGTWTLSEGDHGYLIYNYELHWEDKMYLQPIPLTAKNVNPELGQNEGWQWL